MSWAAVGAASGGAKGALREAKGWDKAGEHYAELTNVYAPEARSMADAYGSRPGDYRGYQADYLQDLLTGRQSITEDPGYQFVYDEAMRATKRTNAAQGYGSHSGQSGNVGAALQDRASGIASQEYDKIISRLMDLSGAGSQNAAAGAQIYGNMVTTGVQGQADAIVGKYNAYSKSIALAQEAVGGVVDNAMSYSGGGAGMSDIRLKRDLNLVGMDGPLHRYTWTWNQKATDIFGLEGTDEGYVAQEVIQYLPEAVVETDGYLSLDYALINKMKDELEARYAA